MATRNVCITEVLDKNKVTSFQIWVLALCIFVTFLDGLDVALIGVTLPRIAKFLHAAPGALGMAVGASLAGPLIGALVLGTLADRFGRKKMLVISALLFGFFTLMTATITSVEQLALMRFLAGLGLGGAIPNALAYGCEFAPTRKRASFATMMYAGMPLGSIPAGFLAAWLLPTHGWQPLYWVGGIPALVVAVLVALFLPESLAFLVRQGTDKSQIRKIVAKLSPAFAADKNTEFYTDEQKLPGVPVKHLFTEGRAFTTVSVWVLFFLSFYLIWMMLAWVPTLLGKSGATVQQSSYAYAFIGVGSFIATITVGRLIDRFDRFRVVAIMFVIAFVAMGAFGIMAKGSFIIVAALAFICGLFVFGTNSGCLAICTISYPVSVRGSGIGWAYAVGKLGSMTAPAVGGILLGWNWSVGRICVVNGLAGVVAAIVLLILGWHTARHKAVQEGVPAVALV